MIDVLQRIVFFSLKPVWFIVYLVLLDSFLMILLHSYPFNTYCIKCDNSHLNICKLLKSLHYSFSTIQSDILYVSHQSFYSWRPVHLNPISDFLIIATHLGTHNSTNVSLLKMEHPLISHYSHWMWHCKFSVPYMWYLAREDDSGTEPRLPHLCSQPWLK